MFFCVVLLICPQAQVSIGKRTPERRRQTTGKTIIYNCNGLSGEESQRKQDIQHQRIGRSGLYHLYMQVIGYTNKQYPVRHANCNPIYVLHKPLGRSSDSSHNTRNKHRNRKHPTTVHAVWSNFINTNCPFLRRLNTIAGLGSVASLVAWFWRGKGDCE